MTTLVPMGIVTTIKSTGKNQGNGEILVPLQTLLHMTGLFVFKVNELQPTLLGSATAYQTEWFPPENPHKSIQLVPTVWEYDGLFLLVSKFSCSAAGTLTLRVIGISRIKF